jgi:protein gp37
MIFTCSMGDLFHEEVPFDFIGRIFVTMAVAERHTFQVLTKRPDRMKEWFDWAQQHKGDDGGASPVVPRTAINSGLWPLPNVWLGVSVENQHWADRRIPLLLETPAAVRFLSIEPLLKPVDLTPFFEPTYACTMPTHVLSGKHGQRLAPIDWTIVGGESGPKHRPMDPAWVEDIRDQCVAADVPLFVKQDAGPTPGQQGRLSDALWALKEFPSAAPG